MAARVLAVFVLVVAALAAGPLGAAPPSKRKGAEATKTLVVYVGKSQVVDAPWPVKRVAVTDPKIADVQVLTPRHILVQGKAVGSTDLVMWSEDEQVVRTLINVAVDIEALTAELKTLFPNTTLTVRQPKDVVIATGSLNRIEQVDQLRKLLEAHELKYVDMTEVAGVHQVLVKVRVAEVSRRAIRELSINALYTGNDHFVGSTIGSDSGGALNPFSIGVPSGTPARHGLPFAFTDDVSVSPAVTLFGGIKKLDLELFLRALAENQYLRVLAEPNLVAMSGREASILVGGEFPIPVVQGTSSGSGTSITVEYREFGTRLRFTPTVLGNGTIQLHVAPEVSELSDVGAVTIQGFQIPSLLTRKTETTVEMKSGQTFAIAGLISRSTGARATRVPGLGDLPVLGALFRSVRYVSGETDLVVLVTPELVEPLSVSSRPPSPGMSHVEPNDWELYALGQIEGAMPRKLAPIDANWLKKSGLTRLRGAGAWARHEQEPARSKAAIQTAPAGTPAEPTKNEAPAK